MADYEILTPDTVVPYLDRTPSLQGIVDTSTLQVREVGDGNLNLVFVCQDADGKGICLKQSLPYVRLVGESWPLTPKRILAEARGLEAGATFAPGLVPGLHDAVGAGAPFSTCPRSFFRPRRSQARKAAHRP